MSNAESGRPPGPPKASAAKPLAMFGKYRIVRELGRGGMGVVYEAVETGLDRKVALKTMIVSPMANPKDAKLDQERFLREAQLCARLPKHPHIVGVYEAGVIEGRRYLTMELIDGKSMSDWRVDPKITLRQEVEVLRDVALAVHHAHEQGVIHRDLKPQNILIDAKDEPHITDFGLAKMVGENLSVSLTGAGMVVGTPAYISPEQAQGLKTTDRRTDVYALGVMLFEILTGRHPFEGQTAMEILMKASKNPAPSAATLLKVRLSPAQAKGLDDICQKALAKKPADRYRDGAAFAADLSKWLKGEEVKVLLQTRRMAAPSKRNSWGLIAGAAVVVVAMAALLLRGDPPPKVDPEAQRRAKAEAARVKAEDEKQAAKTRAEEERLRVEREKLAAERREVEEREKAAESQLQALKTPRFKPAEIRNYAAMKPGLVGEYFHGTNFDILSMRKIDPNIEYSWKSGTAWHDGPWEMISVRWSGYLRVPETGHYVLQARAVEGMKLFVDNVEVLSNWMTRTPTYETAIVILEKGHHSILMEFFKSGSAAAGAWLTCKKSNDPGAPNLGESHYFHDSTGFTPLSRKPTLQLADRKSLPDAQEAEAMPVLEASAGSHGVLPMFARGKGFLLWGRTCKIGDRLKLQFEAAEDGERTLVLALGRAKNAGTYKVSVNGMVLADKLDLYFPNSQFLEHEYKKVPLRKGANELEFTIVASNPQAVEWGKGDGVLKLSLDYLRFR